MSYPSRLDSSLVVVRLSEPCREFDDDALTKPNRLIRGELSYNREQLHERTEQQTSLLNLDERRTLPQSTRLYRATGRSRWYIKVLVEVKIKRAVRRNANILSPAARAKDRCYDEWFDNHHATMYQRFAEEGIKREQERREEEEHRAKEEVQKVSQQEPRKSPIPIMEEDEDDD